MAIAVLTMPAKFASGAKVGYSESRFWQWHCCEMIEVTCPHWSCREVPLVVGFLRGDLWKMIARLSSCYDFDVADWHLMGQLLGLNDATIVLKKN